MPNIKTAVFIDKLLDNWHADIRIKGNYFQTLVGLVTYDSGTSSIVAAAALPAPGALLFNDPIAAGFVNIAANGPFPAYTIDRPTIDDIKTIIKKLYLVFHFRQYVDPVALLPVAVEFNATSNPVIPRIDPKTMGVFNYVLPENYATGSGKRLLSSSGISKDNMIQLKMIIDGLLTIATEADMITQLLTDRADTDGTALTLGGNNTPTTDILPLNKIGGNKQNNNKSNKKMKKIRKRNNKSSKSLR